MGLLWDNYQLDSLNRLAFNRTSKVVQTLLKFWCLNVTAAHCMYIIMISIVWLMCKQWLRWSLPIIYQFVWLWTPYLAACLQYVARSQLYILCTYGMCTCISQNFMASLHNETKVEIICVLDYPALSCNDVSAWASTVVARECCLGLRRAQQKAVPTGPTKGSQQKAK